MALRKLDHVNVRTHRLADMIAFYRDALGMRMGPRPAFNFGGAWMYCGEHPVVHLVEVASAPEPGSALRLEHFAFSADEPDELFARLDRAGVKHSEMTVDDFGLRQVHVNDPDGNHIHIDFRVGG
jgi:catechol 2,3-dioxygenase-like lactoylglutathione lyase family enzyme